MSTEIGLPPPAPARQATRRGGIFYGWWIVLAGTISTIINAAVYYYGMSVFFTPLVQEFGWSRTALSGAFSIARLEAGIVGPISGLLIDRWGPRRMMIVGVSLMSVGFLLLSRIQSLAAFYAIFILLLSVGASLSGGPAVSAAVAAWFVRRRSTALGLLMSGAGIGGFLAGSLGVLIVAFGWRTTLVILGVGVFVVGIPAALVVRRRPEAYGLRPDGDPPQAAGTPAAAKMATLVAVDFQPMQALRTKAFILLVLVSGLRHGASSGLLLHLPTLFVDRGHTLEVAAAIAGLVGLSSVAGRLVCGFAGDRLDKQHVMVVAMLLLAFGLAVLMHGSSYAHIVVFVVTFGVSYGGAVPLTMAIFADYFGSRRYATIYGWAQFAHMWGTVGGPLVAGYVFDSTGSYTTALAIFTAASLLGAVLALGLRRPLLDPQPSPR